ncbi:MAG TPA: TolC family protein [Sunxiuqinia sp.]|nr:TolC family protein [Sunxiuqinia sp.]
MRGRNKIILLILFASIFRPSFAQVQETWSLNKCIQYALDNNLANHLYTLDEQSAKIDVSQSKLNLLPSISASSSAGLSIGRSVDPNTNGIVNKEFFNNSENINSSLTIFRGFIQMNRIAYSKFRLQAAHWQKINNQDDLAFNVLMAYYDVAYYQGVVDIANEQLKLSEFNLNKTKKQIEVGLKAKTDLAEIQSTYEKEKLNRIQAENKLLEAQLKLSQQMNLPGSKLIGIDVHEGEPAAVANLLSAADSLYGSFAQFSPFVKMAEAELQAASKSVAIARGQYFPSVSVGASMSTGYYETNRDQDGKIIPFGDQFDNNMNKYVGASISIPIFGKNQARSELHKAKIAEDQAKTQVEQYRQQVYYELVNNSRAMQAYFREFVQSEKQVEADQLSYQAAQRKYDEGLIDIIELLTVKNRLAEDKAQQLLSRLQWEIKSKVLEFYKGVRFWE